MGRPLDWIVIGFSLMVLFANRMLVQPAAPLATLPETAAAAARSAPATPGRAEAPNNPFAYIREDGTQVFVDADGPVAQPMAMNLEDPHAGSLDDWTGGSSTAGNKPRTAVYTWSSTISSSP